MEDPKHQTKNESTQTEGGKKYIKNMGTKPEKPKKK